MYVNGNNANKGNNIHFHNVINVGEKGLYNFSYIMETTK